MEELDRAKGALLGLFVGDALGTQCEGLLEADLVTDFPQEIGEMYTKDRIFGECGEITEGSELAILLAQSILLNNRFDADNIKGAYRKWLGEDPSLVRPSLKIALETSPLPKSDSNGDLVRIIPVAIYGASKPLKTLMEMAETECMITHLSQVCIDSSKLYVLALAKVITEEVGKEELVGYLQVCASKYHFDDRIQNTLRSVMKTTPIACDGKDKDSVLLALHVALKAFLETSSFEEGMLQIMMKGGSACSNAAIYGALAGAFYGPDSIPDRWADELQAPDSLSRFLRKQAAHRRLNMNLLSMAEDLAQGLLKE
ncbi:ADP-ribosylglycohydrolase [Sphaerochaeta pleomorpha str. Grapes]|uniref:ADP-ribosylglycohydrolase n=1 Tax=Sphaerochaeta pleomorpha (strain ATCC BAA-1885 / DSM 22778 / Grapes) TaxID=158190 RepID=G8QT10_SPHPG|nr:ADP-ribosylglycohydrolase family protein [Sphaerochaeta pleomorpha]AEV27915.1 ADP-ribosylglycohydrolase [Sphaerochaeta pleomorpha str. Grapes]